VPTKIKERKINGHEYRYSNILANRFEHQVTYVNYSRRNSIEIL